MAETPAVVRPLVHRTAKVAIEGPRMNEMRKIIQLHIAGINGHWLGEYADFLALCDDGTIWLGAASYGDESKPKLAEIDWKPVKSQLIEPPKLRNSAKRKGESESYD